MSHKPSRWKLWATKHSQTTEPPLREELFSSEQLQLHAMAMAAQHRIDPKRGPNHLLLRLDENERILIGAYDLVTAAEAGGRHVSPTGEWLLDNFYLIEQQIRATRLHLPRTYSRELPRLVNSDAAGFPRVYAIALELIAHSDGRVDAENVSQFVAAYEKVTSLTLGELWAVPIMLRLGLIENLRRVSEHIARRRRDRNLAGLWAKRFLEAIDEPVKVLQVLAEMAESNPPFTNQFVEEFCTGLEGQGPALATVHSWVRHRLEDQGLTREQLQRSANQNQAADQVSIGHCIGSLRYLNAMDWRQFVETMSGVEAILRDDPAGVYGSMDFLTRDRCRHAVEMVAHRSGEDESTVASRAIGLAKESMQKDGAISRRAHVGFYLIDEGLPELEAVNRVPFSIRRSINRGIRKVPIVSYVGSMLVVTAATLLLLFIPARLTGWQDWRIWLLMLLGIVSASQMAVAMVNLLTNLLVGTRPLPRLDFSKGIPEESRTMAVVPTL
ncbi:MAG: cyclic beta 1-2 glucan synthetase, partial [Verrucomicrobiales bacterium]